MKKLGFVFLLYALFLNGCGTPEQKTHMDLLVETMQDGYVSDWQSITAIDAPPPAPFRYLGGNPIDFTWVPTPQSGRAAEVVVDFFISMGTVGKIKFLHTGSALGVATSTSQIETALNSWSFTNNGSGEVILRLNFGKNEAEFDFSRIQLSSGVTFHQPSFNSAFRGGTIEW
jgi:hypothetical protein